MLLQLLLPLWGVKLRQLYLLSAQLVIPEFVGV